VWPNCGWFDALGKYSQADAGGEQGLKTDSLFYRLFQDWPELAGLTGESLGLLAEHGQRNAF